MNNTEEIRAELDRRKIKWWEDAWDSSHRTIFDGANGVRYCAYEFCGLLYLQTELPVTVEQAISTTVGVGTCEADDTDLIPFVRADSDDINVGYIHVMECSVCGGTYEHVNGSYEFCPRCGRKLVSE